MVRKVVANSKMRLYSYTNIGDSVAKNKSSQASLSQKNTITTVIITIVIYIIYYINLITAVRARYSRWYSLSRVVVVWHHMDPKGTTVIWQVDQNATV